jgi:hypothetical protein
MANNSIINVVDVGNPSSTRRTVDLLPTYIRTDKNTKFLSSTLDQLIQPAKIERISGFVGSTLSPNYNPATDKYIPAANGLEANYQLEPALVVRNPDQTIKKVVSYDDLLNQLAFENADILNHDRLFESSVFSYDPKIDWDKFVNYTQYYWLPTGPDAIEITGQKLATVSTYNVTDDSTKEIFIFSPDGVTPDPLVTLYRGMVYVFNVDSEHNFWIKTAVSSDAQDAYYGASNNGLKKGQVILTIDDSTPETLFYVAGDDRTIAGRFVVRNLQENTKLDVVNEILGKKTFKSGNGITFTNGMKVRFNGNVTPDEYDNKEWLVEGVGSAITLTDWSKLQNAGIVVTNLDVNFDAQGFDQFPFDDFNNIPLTQEYTTINRSSLDINAWSRYNRWFHADVIKAAADANGIDPVYPFSNRATRPIIEFAPNLQLFNYGWVKNTPVDLIDNITIDAFSTVEGTAGFYIDGELLQEGYRVIFNADKDPLVKARIYEVKFVTINGSNVISLNETRDWIPETGASVNIQRGLDNAGYNWWFNGTTWVYAQQKTKINQFPLFDVFDENGISYANLTYYKSNFVGTRIFGYEVGTGSNDPVLGFPLKYLNVVNVGDYLFENFYNTDLFQVITNNLTETYSVSQGYLRFNGDTRLYGNVWKESSTVSIPIIQFQVLTTETNNIEITSLNNPGYAPTITVDVFVNGTKQEHIQDYRFVVQGPQYFVYFLNTLNVNDRVLFQIYTSVPPNALGYYAPALGATNNPLNGPISQLTLAEISDHAKTIANNAPDFVGSYPGNSNLRDIGPLSSYGTRLVSHVTPLSFAQFFIGNPEHNLIDAIRTVSEQYHTFKLALFKRITELQGNYTPADALDAVMLSMTADKNSTFPYGYSDMLAFGTDCTIRTYTVVDNRITRWSLDSVYNNTELTERSISVYLNNNLLIIGQDYIFDYFSPVVEFLTPLTNNDTIVIKDYFSTAGSYIPETPTKLGLYPKFIPSVYVDDTYVTPTKVIQGHDGSIMIAYNDYRDDIILEFETRIYNNIKIDCNPELFDVNTILPGVFRNRPYSPYEINRILTPDFLKWAGFFGIDYQSNQTIDVNDPLTWNYRISSIDQVTKLPLPGHWRGIFKWYYDTDRPHSHPWEMLGFSVQPSWWTSEYGPAPYTSGNLILWSDLRDGLIRQGDRAGINVDYARPNLLDVLPVDEYGNLKNIGQTGIIGQIDYTLVDQNWQFGDHSPAETAYRRSSLWPFAVQILMALTRPSIYASVGFDTSRINKNVAGQHRYGPTGALLSLENLKIFKELDSAGNRILATGYGVFVVEAHGQKVYGYGTKLVQDLSNIEYNLFSKVGGFVSKDKLQVIIDAVDPTSINPGVLLPAEDYEIYFNVSNPTKTYSASGIIVQKTLDGFVLRGYDKYLPYFTIYRPIRTAVDPVVSVGGASETYVTWTAGQFYQAGMVVQNNNAYYRVRTSHTAGITFDTQNFQSLPKLPSVGGVSVYGARSFEDAITTIPYGTTLSSLQEIFDIFVGYGKWLSTQGFMFDEVQPDMGETLDWVFSGREFLYWSTQNWSENSVITLSPFADQVKFKMNGGVVDNLFNEFYEYTILTANGGPFAKNNFNLSRQDGLFTIKTINTTDGLFFIEFSTVQKEHALIFKNISMFNDIIYDQESGYRQLRIKLNGFRTADWNGDFFSPGFVFDEAIILDWSSYTDYSAGEIVRYNGRYYGTNIRIPGAETFDFNAWTQLPNKPTSQLWPNFDYKINQFEDFYSLDIDNFDAGQQRMAQHLIGYAPRTYLDNIFNDPIAQYKFYQGFIKEKGTKNAIQKLAKASMHNLKGEIAYNEVWALRMGSFGGFNTLREIEVALDESKFVENPQIVQFVNLIPTNPTDVTYYKPLPDILISPQDYDPDTLFPTLPSDESTFAENNFVMPYAGYPVYDDIKATVFNKNSILDIANNSQLADGDILWVGFSENGDWDVLRYTEMSCKVIGAALTTFTTNQIVFLTDRAHNLKVGDLVSITQFNSYLNQIYVVEKIAGSEQFVVNTTLSSIPDTGEIPVGLMFNFISARLKNFDDIKNYSALEKSRVNGKVWVDDDGTGKWAVFEKIDNNTKSVLMSSTTNGAQNYGGSMSYDQGYMSYIVSADSFYNPARPPNDIYPDIGRVFVYEKQSVRTADLTPIITYTLNDTSTYYISNTPALFGNTVVYEGSSNYIFATAPYAGNVKVDNTGTIRYAKNESDPAGIAGVGVVKISTIDTANNKEIALGVLTSPAPTANGRFGTSIAVQHNSGKKRLLVGAPGENTGGRVWVYNQYFGGGLSSTATVTSIPASPYASGAEFGHAIGSTRDLSTIVVSAPGYGSNTGKVEIFTWNTSTHQYTSLQSVVIDNVNTTFGYKTSANQYTGAYLKTGDRFGEEVLLTDDAEYMFVSVKNANHNQKSGAVIVFKKQVSGQYQAIQDLRSPTVSGGMVYGTALGLDPAGKILVVTSTGTAFIHNVTFDTYQNRTNSEAYPYQLDPTSGSRNTVTSFDGYATSFYTPLEGSGAAHVYYRYNTFFAYSQDLTSSDISANGDFGASLLVTDSQVLVGAPQTTVNNVPGGEIIIFTEIDTTAQPWNKLRVQPDLVDTDKINRVITIDDVSEEIVDYLEFLDPVKGRIPGLAQQELRFMTSVDPAVYSLGTAGVVVNSNTAWIDDHVGELWWDLSSVKYVWYEQGSNEYRKNNWGSVFPGSTIDVYEWVGSSYLPNQWATIADTVDGLSQGISGQPKFGQDNAVMSVKQVYNSITNAFENVYYYWVKNKTTIPNVYSRTTSAYDIANLIANPKAQGVKYATILSPNAVALVNCKPSLKSNSIHLNIEMDSITDSANRHTEWILLAEDDINILPPTLLIKKLFDSLVGSDEQGNQIPDIKIPARRRYGIEFRPRQGVFVDRHEAIRNLFEYINTVIKTLLLRGIKNFTLLESMDEIPNQLAGTYDQIVEDYATLLFIETNSFDQALAEPVIDEDGRIKAINITTPGYSYNPIYPPSIEIQGDGDGAVAEAICNDIGQISGVIIKSQGSNYTRATAIIRPYSVIVQTDINSGGKWARYEWNRSRGEWMKVQTQVYDTTQYWEYVDWIDPSYNPLQSVITTVESPYELSILTDMPEGNYVKVKNAGDGKYIILRKNPLGSVTGTYDTDWDLVVSEQGTIQFKSILWESSNSVYSYDQTSAFDQTLYDQSSGIELRNILSALITNIFIDDIAIYQVGLLFKAIRYAFSEQKNLDWVFKTTFIDVTNIAGKLDQRPTYKLQDSQFYEDYINEIKPYHTKIRNFTVNYTSTDVSSTFVSDFDLPSYWDLNQKRFRTVGFGNTELLYDPWSSWFKNYSSKIGEIVIADSGDGYLFPPKVEIISAPGDLGTGATAEAHIALGKVSRIIVTNSGAGYSATPTVVITGGGNTNLSKARAYAQLENGKVRSTNIRMKFDRVGISREIGTKTFTDTFQGLDIVNGEIFEWPLTFIPIANKAQITLTVDGVLQLIDQYSIIYTTKDFETVPGTPYKKKYATLHLNWVPSKGSVVQITYPKSLELYTAVDRIEDYYTSESGLAGITTNTYTPLLTEDSFNTDIVTINSIVDLKEHMVFSYENQPSSVRYEIIEVLTNTKFRLSKQINLPAGTLVTLTFRNFGQVFAGAEYAGVKLDTLPFSFTGGWDVLPYWTSSWDSYQTTQNFAQVLNPNRNLRSEIVLLQNEQQDLLQQIITDQIETSSTYATFISTPQFRYETTAAGPKQVPNEPYFSDAEYAYNAAEAKYETDQAKLTAVQSTLNQLRANHVPVQLPFIVDTGTVINTYLNDVRIDGDDHFINVPVAHGGWGKDATFDVTITNTSPFAYYVELRNGGSSYNVKDTLTIFGDSLGGERGYLDNDLQEFINQNDLIIKVTGVTPAGTVTSFTSSGIPNVTRSYVGVGTTGTVYINSSSTNWFNSTGSVNIVTFRSAADDATILPSDEITLDTVIQGGDYNPGITLGVQPAEIVVDGDQFLSSVASHAPEEMVPGQVQESFAVTMFHQLPEGSPLIRTVKYQLPLDPPGLGSLQSFNIAGLPQNTSSVSVIVGTTPLRSEVDYYIDFPNNSITLLNPKTGTDYISISSFGGGGIGLIDYKTSINATTQTQITSSVSLADIKDVYVTIGAAGHAPRSGWVVPKATTSTIGWTLGTAIGHEQDLNPRALLTVPIPTDLGGAPLVQAWFFNGSAKAMSEVYEQVVRPGASRLYIDLEQPPGVAGPFHSQVIVELNRVRLIPPETVYYVAVADNLEYPITQAITYSLLEIDRSQIEVYINGEFISQEGFNYFFDGSKGYVKFPYGGIKDGDAIAITVLDNYEYLVQYNQVVLSEKLTRSNTDELRIFSFTNHDANGLRKEKFYANRAQRYTIQRPIFNTSYLWVEYNGKTLISDIDYTIDSTGLTVTIDQKYYQSNSDVVVILSMSETSYRGALGYRMFTDILGRTSIKRLSETNSTELSTPLLYTDLTINVLDATKLTQPDPGTNRPGIIYVAGERIEFLTVVGNVLGSLRRATLGTGAKEALPTGTTVIDQGTKQNLLVTSETSVYRTTTTNTTTYVFESLTLNSSANAWDQIEVFYGGRKLLKPTTSTNTIISYNTDVVAFDSNETNSYGTQTNVVVLPEFTVTNTSTGPIITLNINVEPNREISVLQRTGQSMFTLNWQEFTDPVGKFLQESPASLPTDSYYGGDTVIILDDIINNGAVLQDELGNPLQGI